PIDPVAYRKTEDAESIDSVFPGCNIVLDQERSAKDSLRKVIFELLKEKKLFEDGESLLDTYEILLGYKPSDDQKCPYSDVYEDNCLSKTSKFIKQQGQ